MFVNNYLMAVKMTGTLEEGMAFDIFEEFNIGPVKIVPDMTYNVFGGTLNPTLLSRRGII